MFQLRIHGRGGQGVVTAAEMVSIAAFEEEKHAQAFPSFGSERTGAPVVSFCRIADSEIRTREPIMEPDALIIQDATLLHQVDVFSGIKPEGYIIINTGKTFHELGLADLEKTMKPDNLITVAATEISLKHLGRSVPNVPLLGALAALTGVIRPESVIHAIGDKFRGKIAEQNSAAAREAYDIVKKEMEKLHAKAN